MNCKVHFCGSVLHIPWNSVVYRRRRSLDLYKILYLLNATHKAPYTLLFGSMSEIFVERCGMVLLVKCFCVLTYANSGEYEIGIKNNWRKWNLFLWYSDFHEAIFFGSLGIIENRQENGPQVKHVLNFGLLLCANNKIPITHMSFAKSSSSRKHMQEASLRSSFEV